FDACIKKFMGYSGKPGVGIARNADDPGTIAFEDGDRGFQFGRLSAVRNGDDHITGFDLTCAAVNTFRAMKKVGGGTSTREQGGNIAGNVFGFADAGHVNASALRFSSFDEIGDSVEIIRRDLCAQSIQFLDCNPQKIVDSVLI